MQIETREIFFYAIKYCSDPIETLGTIIGVILHDGTNSCLRMIGIDGDEDFDASRLYEITPLSQDSEWVYRECVDWFRAVLEEAGDDQEALAQRMEKLRMYAEHITVEKRVEQVFVTTPHDLASAADVISQRLIGTEGKEIPRSYLWSEASPGEQSADNASRLRA